MLIYNKYLKELGYKKDDFPFKKEDERYNLDKEHGVVEAQTWNLHMTMILELYTYMRFFQEHLMHKGIPAFFVEKYENGKFVKVPNGEKKWYDIIQQIVDGLKAYIIAENDFQYACTDEEKAQRDKLHKQFDGAWKLLGEYMGCLWW